MLKIKRITGKEKTHKYIIIQNYSKCQEIYLRLSKGFSVLTHLEECDDIINGVPVEVVRRTKFLWKGIFDEKIEDDFTACDYF